MIFKKQIRIEKESKETRYFDRGSPYGVSEKSGTREIPGTHKDDPSYETKQ